MPRQPRQAQAYQVGWAPVPIGVVNQGAGHSRLPELDLGMPRPGEPMQPVVTARALQHGWQQARPPGQKDLVGQGRFRGQVGQPCRNQVQPAAGVKNFATTCWFDKDDPCLN